MENKQNPSNTDIVLNNNMNSTTAGFLYPAYSSYKAIRTNDTQAIEVWLMFWVVMAGIHTVENTVEWTVNWCEVLHLSIGLKC